MSIKCIYLSLHVYVGRLMKQVWKKSTGMVKLWIPQGETFHVLFKMVSNNKLFESELITLATRHKLVL